MFDLEKALDYLEQQIPGLSAASVDVACWQTPATGHAVLVSDEGGILRVFPEGTPAMVKTKPVFLSLPGEPACGFHERAAAADDGGHQ